MRIISVSYISMYHRRRARGVLRETLVGEVLGLARSFVLRCDSRGNLNRGVTARGAFEAHEVAVCLARFFTSSSGIHRDMIGSQGSSWCMLRYGCTYNRDHSSNQDPSCSQELIHSTVFSEHIWFR